MTGTIKRNIYNTPIQLWYGSTLLTSGTEIDVNVSDYDVLVFIYCFSETGIFYQREYYKTDTAFMTLEATDPDRWCYLQVVSGKLKCGAVGANGGVYLKKVYGIRNKR